MPGGIPSLPPSRAHKNDWFLWLLWAILIVGFAGVSFVVYAVIYGTAPVVG